MKRFLALVSAVAVCFCSLSFSFAASSMESEGAAKENDVSIVDVVNVYTTQGYISSIEYPFELAQRIDTPEGTYFRFTASPAGSSHMLCVIFELSDPQPFYPTDYYSFSYTNYANIDLYAQGVGNTLEGAGYRYIIVGDHQVSPYSTDYSDYFLSLNFAADRSSQTYRYYCLAFEFESNDPVTLTIGPLYRSSSFLSEPPVLPGFEDEDGWLGQLINSILGGIQQLIDGLGEVGTQITGAVTDIGNQISNALGSLGDTISGFWNSDQTHNSEVDSAGSQIEDLDSQYQGVEDEIVEDFKDQNNTFDIAGFEFPAQIIPAMSWLSQFVMTIWNGLGVAQFPIILSCTLGIALLFIGRLSRIQ